MLKSLVPAVAIVALAFSIPASLRAAEPSPSPAVAKVFGPAQDDFKAKRYGDAIRKAEDALAVSGATPYDKFVIHRFLLQNYSVQENKAEMLKAWQAMLDTGHPAPAEQNQILKGMFGTHAQMKNYPQVVEFGNRLIRSGAADSTTYDQVADSLDKQGKPADAIKFLSDYVAGVERSGQKPREQTLVWLRALQDKSGNKAAAMDTLKKLVVLYPKPDYWNLLLYSLGRSDKASELQTMNILRLKVDTQTLKRCQDSVEYAEMAIDSGVAGEAQKVMERAISSKACSIKVDVDKLQRMQATAGREIAADKASFPKREAEARAARTGVLDVELGATLFGYGEYAKSIEALSRGLGKGGLKYPADVQVLLAIAQFRAGNKPEAVKTLQSIKGGDQMTKNIVDLWLLHLAR